MEEAGNSSWLYIVFARKKSYQFFQRRLEDN